MNAGGRVWSQEHGLRIWIQILTLPLSGWAISGKCSRFLGLSYLTVKWIKDKTFLDGVVRLTIWKGFCAPSLEKSQSI